MADENIIFMKQGDDAAMESISLTGADGSPANLTGATPKINIKKGDQLIVDHGALVVDDAVNGEVHFDGWASVDPAVFAAMVGDYSLEVEVTYGNGKHRTFPNDSYITLRVTKQLA
jgi:hypothetical protein